MYISFRITDEKGVSSTTRLYYPDGNELIDYIELAQGLGNLLTPLITGAISSVELCFGVDISGLANNTVQAGSDVEEGARAVWETAGGWKASNRFATFADSYMVPNSNLVDATDPDVDALVQALTGGIVTITNTVLMQAEDYRGDDIAALSDFSSAFTRTRKIRR